MTFANKMFSDDDISIDDIPQYIKNNENIDVYFILADDQSKNIMEIVSSKFAKTTGKVLIGVSKSKQGAYALVLTIITHFISNNVDIKDLKHSLLV